MREYDKLKAEYAELFAMKAAGASKRLRMYEILISDAERDCSGVGGVNYDKVGSNPNAYVDGVHDQAMRTSSSMERWKSGRREAKALVDAAARAISKVQEPAYRQILELRYLDCFGWKQVAMLAGCSTSTAMHMRLPALASLHDCMPEQFRVPGYDAAPASDSAG